MQSYANNGINIVIQQDTTHRLQYFFLTVVTQI